MLDKIDLGGVYWHEMEFAWVGVVSAWLLRVDSAWLVKVDSA